MNSLSGSIKDGEWAQPVEGVKVLHLAGGTTTPLTVSDQKGSWHIPEPPEGGHILFSKPGYVEKIYRPEEIPKLVRLLKKGLAGYQDKLWYTAGEQVKARVQAPDSYRATLYRHGIRKEELGCWKELPSQNQLLPDGVFVEGGLDWESSLEYRIPVDARPGIYSLLLESGGQKNAFAIPFVVSTPRHAKERKPILVLASTNNWQCYNIWGGRSRYRNFEEGKSDPYLRDTSAFTEFLATAGKFAPRPLVKGLKRLLGMPQSDPPWKFRPLSIRRPFTNCALEGDTPLSPFTNHLAAGEWRVLAWLEREGYDYDIVTGYELHQRPGLLEHYRAIVLSTHCEYWSETMYAGLKAAHNKGLSILNLSGNSIYREVDFQEDGSIFCRSLKFEEGVEDETQVMGVRFTEGDMGSCAPYRVTHPGHWIFAGLGLREGQLFGDRSLNRRTPRDDDFYDPGRLGTVSGLSGEGASGWETDKLSRTAPKDFTLVAKGQNRGGGADMVVREPQHGRGGVFSASSITFGGALLVDEICSGITRNVLNRFARR